MTEGVFHNKYSLVKGAARRARQLQNGAPATIATNSMKACRVAQDEIRQGHVSYVLPLAKAALITDPPVESAPGEAEIQG